MAVPPDPTIAPPARTAAEIARGVALGRKARSLLTPEVAPGPFLALLIRGHLSADTVRFIAHSLLNREAVWWACLCVREGWEASSPPPEQRHALGAAVRWVLDPTEARRHEARRAALAAGRITPGGFVARAAALASAPDPTPAASPRPVAGGAPAELMLPVTPTLAAKLCAGAVLLAATREGARHLGNRSRLFIGLGLDVAYGTNRWQ